MTHIRVRFTRTSIQLLSIAALAVALLATATGHATAAVLIPAATALLLIGAVTYRSRTVLQWIWHRATYRQRRRNNQIHDHKGTGVTWDGSCAAAYIEILPSPYEVTILDGDKITPERVIPIDDIREELLQYDIHCHHIRAYTIGYKYNRESNLANILHATVGPTEALFHGRTMVEVSIAINDAIDSLNARKTKSSNDADGLNNTVTTAAERIRRRISAAGRPATLLDATQLSDLDNELRHTLVPALLDERWSSAGKPTMRAVSYSPDNSAWNRESYRQWCKLNPHRHIHSVTLTPAKHGDRAEIHVTTLATDSTDLNAVTSLGLRTEYGQQGDIITTYIPSVHTHEPTAIPGRIFGNDTPFPIPLMPAGIGTYLGTTKTRARVFVNFANGAAPFYLICPPTLTQQLLMRLATTGQSIDIDIDNDEWRRFAKRIGASSATQPDADIVLTADHAQPQMKPHQVRLVWTTNADNLPRRPDYAIVAGPQECALYTPDGVTRYLWSTTAAEEAFFTYPTGRTTPGQPHHRNPPPPPPRTPQSPPRPPATPPAPPSTAQQHRAVKQRHTTPTKSSMPNPMSTHSQTNQQQPNTIAQPGAHQT